MIFPLAELRSLLAAAWQIVTNTFEWNVEDDDS